VFKYIKRDELKEQLGKVVRLAADISDAQLAKTTLEVILEYISNAKTVLTNNDVEKVIHEVEEERGEKMSNFIEVWFERGKQAGLQEGKLEGMLEGKLEGEQEGIKKGLLDGLETALDIKFGIEGLRLMSELHNIKNVELLQTLRSAVKTANTPQELRSIYQ
jgi:predicted transposase YdaD